MMPASPTTNATDMSKLQVISNIVWPSAIMPRIDTAHMMLRRFLGVRKTSDSDQPASIRTKSKITAVWLRAMLRRRPGLLSPTLEKGVRKPVFVGAAGAAALLIGAIDTGVSL